MRATAEATITAVTLMDAHHSDDTASVRAEPKAAVPEGTIYTCPMHPQIRQIGPGNCRSAAWRWSRKWQPRHAAQPELADMTRRFWIGLALSCRRWCWRWAVISSAVTADRRDALELDPACLRHTRGRLGRLAVLRARLASRW
jgi:hypothetical protein